MCLYSDCYRPGTGGTGDGYYGGGGGGVLVDGKGPSGGDVYDGLGYGAGGRGGGRRGVVIIVFK